MAVNKVEINGEVKLDLTQDTVTPENLLSGATAHNAAGELIAGEYIPPKPAQPGVAGDITFYDYDGTVVTSWSLSELAGKTALPDLPSHDGLVCQGWNWTLAELKAQNTRMNVGAMYITDDGKTRIYIHLEEGRTSPMLGLGVNGTVTVDWGDGTTPDTLTGTNVNTPVWTPTHNYTAPGDYVIQLTVTGRFSLIGTAAMSSCVLAYRNANDSRNQAYRNAIQKIEIGSGFASFLTSALFNCSSLASITIPSGVMSIIGDSTFSNCRCLASITIPSGVTSIKIYAFIGCNSLISIAIPSGITSIGSSAFGSCYSLAFYDFTHHTSVPTLSDTSAFTGIAADCQIRVPVALVDEWKAATNWATYADYIVGV